MLVRLDRGLQPPLPIEHVASRGQQGGVLALEPQGLAQEVERLIQAAEQEEQLRPVAVELLRERLHLLLLDPGDDVLLHHGGGRLRDALLGGFRLFRGGLAEYVLDQPGHVGHAGGDLLGLLVERFPGLREIGVQPQGLLEGGLGLRGLFQLPQDQPAGVPALRVLRPEAGHLGERREGLVVPGELVQQVALVHPRLDVVVPELDRPVVRVERLQAVPHRVQGRALVVVDLLQPVVDLQDTVVCLQGILVPAEPVQGRAPVYQGLLEGGVVEQCLVVAHDLLREPPQRVEAVPEREPCLVALRQQLQRPLVALERLLIVPHLVQRVALEPPRHVVRVVDVYREVERLERAHVVLRRQGVVPGPHGVLELAARDLHPRGLRHHLGLLGVRVADHEPVQVEPAEQRGQLRAVRVAYRPLPQQPLALGRDPARGEHERVVRTRLLRVRYEAQDIVLRHGRVLPGEEHRVLPPVRPVLAIGDDVVAPGPAPERPQLEASQDLLDDGPELHVRQRHQCAEGALVRALAQYLVELDHQGPPPSDIVLSQLAASRLLASSLTASSRHALASSCMPKAFRAMPFRPSA